MRLLLKLWQGIVSFIESNFAWFSPLLARVSVGYVFLLSGWGKIHNIPHVTSFFTDLGIPAPGFNAYLVATTEISCGLALIIGIFSRLAAFPLIITMIVAMMTAKKGQIAGLKDFFMFPEYLFIVILVWVITAGPGPISLDRLLRKGK